MPDASRHIEDGNGKRLSPKAADAVADPYAMRELLGEEVESGIALKDVVRSPYLKGVTAQQQRQFYSALRDGIHESIACQIAGIDPDTYQRAFDRCADFRRAIWVNKGLTMQHLQQSLLKLAMGEAEELTTYESDDPDEPVKRKRRRLAPDTKALQMLLKAMGAPGFADRAGPPRVEIHFSMGSAFPKKGQHFDPALLPACGDREIPVIEAEVVEEED